VPFALLVSEGCGSGCVGPWTAGHALPLKTVEPLLLPPIFSAVSHEFAPTVHCSPEVDDCKTGVPGDTSCPAVQVGGGGGGGGGSP
jgi:hypothetical protein